MTTPKPAWAGEYGVGYEDIVKSWGYEVLAFETFGSYQGDHLALLRGPMGHGLLVMGYGSCSGCDHLQGIAPWNDSDDWSPVLDFAAQLHNSIEWRPDAERLRDYIDENPEKSWWSYDDAIARWLDANLGTHLKTPVPYPNGHTHPAFVGCSEAYPPCPRLDGDDDYAPHGYHEAGDY